MKKSADKLTVGYVRVSTDKQARDGQSLEAQELRIKQYAALSGHSVDRVYRDSGESAKGAQRPALDALRRDIGCIGVVIVYKFDRISRSVVNLYQLLEEFESHGIEFRSVSEGVDTGSAVGRFIMSTLASLAQMERELIAERTRDTLESKRLRGEHVGRVPFGFRISPVGSLEADSAQQRMISKMRRMYRNGKSIRSISSHLQVPKSTVNSILQEPTRSRNRRLLRGLRSSTVR